MLVENYEILMEKSFKLSLELFEKYESRQFEKPSKSILVKKNEKRYEQNEKLSLMMPQTWDSFQY